MPENQNIEWKASWSDKYLKWICGFANAQGGELVIGKNDRGEVAGIPNASKLLEDIPNQVRDLMGIVVEVNCYQQDELDYLVIKVEPYSFPVSLRGAYHFRSGSTKQELKGAALDKFLLRKYGKHWDGVPVPHVMVDELDTRILASFRKQALNSKRLADDVLAENDAVLVDKLHLIEGDYLKRATVLLFHPDPEKFVTGAYIKIGFFRTDADLLYHDEVHGDLFSQVNTTIDLLLTKYFRAMISYEGLQRIETYPVPEAALREAVLNAVIHKDYASAAPIQISVYEDKLMIWNSGQLPENWDVTTLLQKHSSRPYNPDIANAFFRAGMIESWGRGIERISQSCKDAGIALPEFKCEHSDFWAVFSFADHDVGEDRTEKARVETRVKTRVKTPEMIIAILRDNPQFTLSEVAAHMGKSLSAVERAVAKLVKEGRLHFVGPKKGGHWEVLK